MTTISAATDRVVPRNSDVLPVDAGAGALKLSMEHFNGVKHAKRLPNWRKAMAGVRAGTGNARILCVGDSTTEGFGSGETYYLNNKSYPDFLRKGLIKAGYDATMNSLIGYGNSTGGGNFSIHSLFSTTSAPAHNATGVPLGGLIVFDSDAKDLTFSPEGSVDRFRFWSAVDDGATRSFDLTLDPAGTPSVTTWNVTSGTETIARTTVSATLGTNVMKIDRSTGSDWAYLMGVEAYKSAGGQIIVANAGVGSSGSDYYDGAYGTGKKWFLANTWGFFDPDLVIINLGINDWKDGNTTAANYKIDLEELILGILAASTDTNNSGLYAKDIDIVLVVANPTSGHTTTDYVTAIYDLARTYDLVVLDVHDRWIDYATANAAGYMADTLHPSATGYADIAQLHVNALVSV